jgi:hypothetical protein
MEGLELFDVLFLKLIFNEIFIVTIVMVQKLLFSFVLDYDIVVLYGCRTWPVTVSEEMIFENTILSRVWGPKGEEV